MSESIRFTLNGKPVTLETDADRSLLWALRTDLELTGTKYGCGEGLCGSCTVLIDNEVYRSCTIQIGDIAGQSIITIEGLSSNGQLHPIQSAFIEKDALQCGYCTPGMIISAYGLLLNNPEPTRQEVIEGMEGNLCRCGAHIRIIEAIQSAGHEMKGAKSS